MTPSLHGEADVTDSVALHARRDAELVMPLALAAGVSCLFFGIFCFLSYVVLVKRSERLKIELELREEEQTMTAAAAALTPSIKKDRRRR